MATLEGSCAIDNGLKDSIIYGGVFFWVFFFFWGGGGGS